MVKNNFQPIVMPCTQKQYASLIPILKKNNIRVDEIIKTVGSLTITNNHNGVSRFVSWNVHDLDSTIHIVAKRKVYKRFNRKLFLKSLGIVEIVEEPEFVLPEKWLVTYANREEFDIINKHFKKGWLYTNSINTNGYFSSDSPLLNNWVRSENDKKLLISQGYTEITFEQFKEHVLTSNKQQSILESQSVTNKQTTMKSTVEEIKQPEPRIKKGLLVVTQERVGIVTKYISDNNFDVTILHPSDHHGLIVTNLHYGNIRIFKGKLTLEQ